MPALRSCHAARDVPYEFNRRIVENVSWRLEVKAQSAHHVERYG